MGLSQCCDARENEALLVQHEVFAGLWQLVYRGEGSHAGMEYAVGG
jgi:hypothetical protein